VQAGWRSRERRLTENWQLVSYRGDPNVLPAGAKARVSSGFERRG